MDAVRITDADDPRVGDFRHLNSPAVRRQVEAAGPFHHGLFVVEGWLPLERLLRSRFEPRAVLADEARLDRVTEALGPRSTLPVYLAQRPVLDEIVGFPLHRGVVATAERGLPLIAANVMARGQRVVVLEGVNDAENMGAIARNAVALGADGLLLDPTSCDPLSRRSIRVSVGHALDLPTARVAWPEGIETLRKWGYLTVALTPRPDATEIEDVKVGPDQQVAVALGAEGPGLSADAIAACDVVARIPMARGVDSLNVASAAAIAMHRLFMA